MLADMRQGLAIPFPTPAVDVTTREASVQSASRSSAVLAAELSAKSHKEETRADAMTDAATAAAAAAAAVVFYKSNHSPRITHRKSENHLVCRRAVAAAAITGLQNVWVGEECCRDNTAVGCPKCASVIAAHATVDRSIGRSVCTRSSRDHLRIRIIDTTYHGEKTLLPELMMVAMNSPPDRVSPAAGRLCRGK